MNAKCQTCKTNQAEWAWQPFGPDEGTMSFSLLGSHYRGFPVVKMCDACKVSFCDTDNILFAYKGATYRANRDSVTQEGQR